MCNSIRYRARQLDSAPNEDDTVIGLFDKEGGGDKRHKDTLQETGYLIKLLVVTCESLRRLSTVIHAVLHFRIQLLFPVPFITIFKMLPSDPSQLPSLFSRSELRVLDGFFDAQLGPSTSSTATPISIDVNGLTMARNSLAHRSNPMPIVSSSTTHVHSTPSLLFPSEIMPPRSPSPYSSYDSYSPDERKLRLKSQAEDLASWFSSVQAGPSIHTHTHVQGLTGTGTAGGDVPALEHGHEGEGSGLSSSSASSTSNSDNLPPTLQKQPDLPLTQKSLSSHPFPNSKLQHSRILTGHVSDDLAPPQAKRARSFLDTIESLQDYPSAQVDYGPAHSATSPVSATRGRARARGSSTSTARKKASSLSAGTGGSGSRPSPASSTKTYQPIEVEICSKESSINLESPLIATTINSTSSVLVTDGSAGSSKIVLTEAQKKANHIASEQKRRTAIRSAYDDLCTIVPALKAAIQEYDERLNKLHGFHHHLAVAAANQDVKDGEEAVQRPKTLQTPLTVAGVLTGGIEVGGEKVDGRAGPKSEAVVLGQSKSIYATPYDVSV